MKSFMHFFVAILSVVMITACGKTSSEQAKSDADSAIAEFKVSANAVDALQVPSTSWTDAQFDQYDATVRDCSAKADRVESFDGKDGVVVYGTWNLPTLRRLLAHKLEYSAEVRRNRVSNAARVSAQVEDVVRQSRETRVSTAYSMYFMEHTDMQLVGKPNRSWTQSKRAADLERITRAEGYLSELEGLRGTTSVPYDLEEARRTLDQRRHDLESLQ